MDNNKKEKSWFAKNWKLVVGIFFTLAFIASFFIDVITSEIKAVLAIDAFGFILWNFYREGESNMIFEIKKKKKSNTAYRKKLQSSTPRLKFFIIY